MADETTPAPTAADADPDYQAFLADKAEKQAKLDAENAKQAERDKPESKLRKYDEELRAFLTEVGRHLSLTPPVHPDDVPAETDAPV
jgi:hypothetical protein